MQKNLGGQWRLLGLTFALLLSFSAVHAEPEFATLEEELSNLDLRPYVEHWVEEKGSRPASIEDIAADDHSLYAVAWQSSDDNHSYGYTDATYWFRWRLNVAPGAQGEWWLQVAPTFLDSVELYVPQGDGAYQQVQLGDHVPQHERPIASRHFLAPLELAAGNTDYYYLRVKTSSTLTLGLTAWQPAAYSYALGIENSLYGLLFGLVLATVMISLISGLWIRKPFYFVTAAFVFCNGAMHFILNGYDQLFYVQGSDWSDRLMALTNFSAGAFGVALCLVFLRPHHYFPKLSKLMWGLAGGSGIFALLALFGFPQPLVAVAGSTLILILMSILIVLMLRHRFVPALLMLILFVPGFLSLLFQIARNFSLLPFNFWTTHIWAILSIFQAPYIALVVMLHLRAQEKAFLSEQQKARVHRDLVSMVAHEVRTPLAIVGSAVANIELQTQQSHPELAPRFLRVNLSLARLNGLIDNALAEDRLLDEGIQMQREWITLEQLAEGVKELRLVDDPHSLSFEVSDAQTAVFADPHWLGLAVLNLLDNAIKYSPEGGDIQMRFGREDNMAVIQVVDEGIGIPRDAADTIFQKFFRADNARSVSGAAGMGLGLFLVSTVVDLHQGSIHYRPNPRGGSIFTLSVPLSPAKDGPARKRNKTQ